MDASLIITIAIFVITSIGGLVGVIWTMHNRRVDALDKRVEANRAEVARELKDAGNDMKVGLMALAAKLEALTKEISQWQLRDRAELVTKTECEKLRERCQHG